MLTLGNDPQRQLVAFVRSWFKRVAAGDWDTAVAALDEPSGNGTQWTRDLVVATVNETFSPGTRFFAEFGFPVFSDPDTTIGSPHVSFGVLDAGGFWLDHSVPLNGTFSDLTVQFEFYRRGPMYAAVLHDLHVL